MICKVCAQDMKPVVLLEHVSAENDILRCPECKITFVHPQPTSDELTAYYNGMYKNLTVAFNQAQLDRARFSMKGYMKSLDWTETDRQDRTFLDLGGGLGYYSKAAIDYGLNPILVEKDPVSVDFARNHLNLSNIIEKDLDDFFENASHQYDVVFFRHVIEHVTEPRKVIHGISKILKADGVLIIETDNNAGIEILFNKGSRKFYMDLYKSNFKNVSFLNLLFKRPFALDPPRHLFGFRMKNLCQLLESNDLSPFIKDHYRLGHPVYWPNIATPKLSTSIRAFKRLKFKAGFFHLLKYLNLHFRKVLQSFGLSSGLCIYARKTSS